MWHELISDCGYTSILKLGERGFFFNGLDVGREREKLGVFWFGRMELPVINRGRTVIRVPCGVQISLVWDMLSLKCQSHIQM